jgi:hypothetical protein
MCEGGDRERSSTVVAAQHLVNDDPPAALQVVETGVLIRERRCRYQSIQSRPMKYGYADSAADGEGNVPGQCVFGARLVAPSVGLQPHRVPPIQPRKALICMHNLLLGQLQPMERRKQGAKTITGQITTRWMLTDMRAP